MSTLHLSQPAFNFFPIPNTITNQQAITLRHGASTHKAKPSKKPHNIDYPHWIDAYLSHDCYHKDQNHLKNKNTKRFFF
ncbi:MAG: hypothetical protein ACK4PR_07740 [Gammaproteobacteria bacterium]